MSSITSPFGSPFGGPFGGIGAGHGGLSGAGDVIRAVVEGELVSSASFARSDPANIFNSNGLLESVAANIPRKTYLPVNGVLVPHLQVDGEVTEISGRSADLDNWNAISNATVGKNAVGLDGQADTGWTLTDSDGLNLGQVGNAVVITSGTDTYYAHYCIKKNISPSAYPHCLTGVRRGTTAVTSRLVLDPSDGAVTAVGTSGKVLVVLIGDHWHVIQSVTDNGSGNDRLDHRVDPAYNTDGSSTQDASATGSQEVVFGGVYKNAFSLMPILTDSGTTATVAADVASLVNSIISGLTEGMIYAEVWVPNTDHSGYLAELRTDANNRVNMRRTTDGRYKGDLLDGGVSQGILSGSVNVSAGTLQKVAVAFAENDRALYVDGTQEDTDNTATIPSFTELVIGSSAGSSNFFHGGIKTLNVYPTRPSNSQLASLTT